MNIEVCNVHYTKDDPNDDPFTWGMLAEWYAPDQGLGGVVFREGKRKDFDEKSFTEMVREFAEDYATEYIKSPGKSTFANLSPGHEGRIDFLGEVQTCTYKGIKGIRAFVGKEDYNIYFWPKHLISSTDSGTEQQSVE